MICPSCHGGDWTGASLGDPYDEDITACRLCMDSGEICERCGHPYFSCDCERDDDLFVDDLLWPDEPNGRG